MSEHHSTIKKSLFLFIISIIAITLFMPVISMFYGIIIAMYYLDTKQHSLPHIYVKYQEHEAVFMIPEGNLLEGFIPNNKEKLVIAWIELHKDELMADWELAVNGQKIFSIDPLK